MSTVEGAPAPTVGSWKGALYLVGCGFCMGTADLVPGISGGTIAFLLGFYPDLIRSLRTWRSLPWLLTLASGAGLAMLTLSRPLLALLHHPVGRIYLYSAFLGFIAASSVACARRAGRAPQRLLWTVAGALLAYGVMEGFMVNLAVTTLSLIGGGAAAICAMLLPGISGSTVLHLLGLYPSVIEAIANLGQGLAHGAIHWESLGLLATLGVGIVIGALSFCRLLALLLKKYPGQLSYAMTGMMVGSLPTLWPFAGTPELGPLTLTAAAFGLVLLLDRLELGNRSPE